MNNTISLIITSCLTEWYHSCMKQFDTSGSESVVVRCAHPMSLSANSVQSVFVISVTD